MAEAYKTLLTANLLIPLINTPHVNIIFTGFHMVLALTGISYLTIFLIQNF